MVADLGLQPWLGERDMQTLDEVARGDLSVELMREPDVDRAAAIALEKGQARGVSAEYESALERAVQRFRDFQSGQTERLRRVSLRKQSGEAGWYGGPLSEDVHWPALKTFIEVTRGWGSDTVAAIDTSSTDVVSLLGNPGAAQMTVKGLVVGYVQSGKTANMTAVIAKAADRRYRLIIVLAGMTNALRRQTQERLQADLVSRNVHCWDLATDADRDFRQPANKRFPKLDPSVCRVAVIKKNVSPMTELIKTLKESQMHLTQWPVLIIDDECDQASVNSSSREYDVSRINQLIREIIGLVPRVTYVGYTATPFANVLIDPGTPEDLYPSDFIKALPRPAGYFGADTLFGRDDAEAEGGEGDGLAMIEHVSDDDVAVLQPARAADRESFEPEMAPSLRRAVLYYLLVSAVRHIRGQGDQHCCMLVHTSVYTAMHEKVAGLITELLEEIRRAVREPSSGLVTEASEVWAMKCRKVSASRFGHVDPDVGDILSALGEIIGSVDVPVENAVSDSRLNFSGSPRRSIVVGGSVLSRGLTIEGLTVSYFLRSSSQYDTLLQMGRWFGYRHGYEDLPRIWMTPGMESAFSDLAAVEREIREDIAVYGERELTPLQFGVRIRKIPGMQITARSRMRSARDCDISYSGEHAQTFRFAHRDSGWLEQNWRAGAELVDGAGSCETVASDPWRRVWTGVPYRFVRAFLNAYRIHRSHLFGPAERLVEYIDSENGQRDELQTWNVGIIGTAEGSLSRLDLGHLGRVPTVRRSRLSSYPDDANIKALMSVQDILADVPHAGERPRSWEDCKALREARIGRVPLILLYPIEARSEPKSGGQDAVRVALDAAGDVLGMGIVFPYLGERTAYVTVKLPDPEPEDEDLGQVIDAITEETADE